MKRLLFHSPLLLLLVCSTSSQATHIVGGELNYSNLGNNNYRVELKLYKDCGTSIVPFDNPATIYVYGSNNLFLFSFEIPLVDRDTLEAAFMDPCLMVPPDVCVDYARYELNVNLPAIPGDYTLAYIRCCRNSTILNAEGEDEFGNPLPPDLIGATYAARIPGSPIVNSNPVYNEFPPIIVCSGQVISVDQSAFDADGDSLVYSLCTPNVGGSLVNVFGNPLLERPPFEQVIWVEPYGLDNIMGGDPPLAINARTGRLTGRAPLTIGQFVVGVCVREYRNGALLSENKRDFQFNIADCQPVIASLYDIEPEPFQDTLQVSLEDSVFDYVLLCDTDNLAVQFYGTIEGSGSAVWDFGDGSPLVTALDPVHIFPDTGFYLVTLIGGPGESCADTFSQLINVQLQRSIADLSFTFPQCYDPVTGMPFTDLTTSPENIESWTWEFGDGGVSGQQDPVHFYGADGEYEISLSILERNGCRSRLDTVLAIVRLDTFALSDTLSLCAGDTVRLDLEIEGEHEYLWSPSATLDRADVRDPLAFPESNTVYTVQIRTLSPSGDTCVQEATVAVLTDTGLPAISDITTPFQCNSPVRLRVAVDANTAVAWAREGEFTTVIGTGPVIFAAQPSGIVAYYVKATRYNCTSLDTIVVEQHAIRIEGDDQLVCRGDRTAIRPEVTSLNDSFTYIWTPEGGEIDDAVPEYVFYPQEAATVTLLAENSTGCTASAAFQVDLSTLPELDARATPDVIAVPREVVFLAVDDDIYQYAWEPAELFNDPAQNSPVAFVTETTVFTVTVTDANGCPHSDSVTVLLLEPCDDRNIFIPTAFSPNGDGLNDLFRVQTQIAETLILSVYDRWGNKVFETDDPAGGWDGTFEGRNLGNDVFGFILQVVCTGGERYVKRGSVSLIR